MAGRRLSIFQMLKDLKDTVSPVNPSSSDGPSSIFYVSSEQSGTDCSDSHNKELSTDWLAQQSENNSYYPADGCQTLDYYDHQEGLDSLKSLEERDDGGKQAVLAMADSDKRATSAEGGNLLEAFGLDNNKSPIRSSTRSSKANTPTPFRSMEELDLILQTTFPNVSEMEGNNSQENGTPSDNNTKKKSKSKSILSVASAAWKFKRRDSKRDNRNVSADQFGDFSTGEQNDAGINSSGPLSLESDYVVHRRRSSAARKLFKRKSKCDSTDSTGSSGGNPVLSGSLSSGVGSGSTMSFNSELSGITGKGSVRSSTSSDALSDVFNWNFLQKLRMKVRYRLYLYDFPMCSLCQGRSMMNQNEMHSAPEIRLHYSLHRLSVALFSVLRFKFVTFGFIWDPAAKC